MNLKFIGLKKLLAEEMSPKSIKTVIKPNQILLSDKAVRDLFINKWDSKKNIINKNGRSSKLIPNIPKPKLGSIKVEKAIRKPKININGRDLNTKDGTPERDFIHIEDLCKIHEKAYKYLITNKKIILNCGSGVRYSVLRVIKAYEKKIKKKFRITYKIVNPDETQTICSNVNQIKNLLKMSIEKKEINDLIKDYL